MRFKSPTETPIPIALTSGHTALIGVEYEELAAIFHREAIANGAVPEPSPDVVGIEPENEPFDRKSAIEDAINVMLNGAADGDFSQDGKPDTGRLSAIVGFTVGREERDAVWYRMSDIPQPIPDNTETKPQSASKTAPLKKR